MVSSTCLPSVWSSGRSRGLTLRSTVNVMSTSPLTGTLGSGSGGSTTSARRVGAIPSWTVTPTACSRRSASRAGTAGRPARTPSRPIRSAPPQSTVRPAGEHQRDLLRGRCGDLADLGQQGRPGSAVTAASAARRRGRCPRRRRATAAIGSFGCAGQPLEHHAVRVDEPERAVPDDQRDAVPLGDRDPQRPGPRPGDRDPLDPGQRPDRPATPPVSTRASGCRSGRGRGRQHLVRAERPDARDRDVPDPEHAVKPTTQTTPPRRTTSDGERGQDACRRRAGAAARGRSAGRGRDPGAAGSRRGPSRPSAARISGPSAVTSPAPMVMHEVAGPGAAATSPATVGPGRTKTTRPAGSGTASAISSPVTPGTGSSRAAYTSRTTASSARPSAAPKSSAKAAVRLNRCGWKTTSTRPSPATVAGRRSCGRDLGRVVGVVVVDGDAAGGAA